MTDKIIGYILLVLGLLIIVYTAFDVYQVFTKQKDPVKLFAFPGISIDAGQFMPQDLPPELQAQLGSQKPQKMEMISGDVLSEPLNYSATLFLMGFIGSIGYKLASLGIQLIRPIVVKLKAKEVEVDASPTNTQ